MISRPEWVSSLTGVFTDSKPYFFSPGRRIKRQHILKSCSCLINSKLFPSTHCLLMCCDWMPYTFLQFITELWIIYLLCLVPVFNSVYSGYKCALLQDTEVDMVKLSEYWLFFPHCHLRTHSTFPIIIFILPIPIHLAELELAGEQQVSTSASESIHFTGHYLFLMALLNVSLSIPVSVALLYVLHLNTTCYTNLSVCLSQSLKNKTFFSANQMLVYQSP